MNKHANQLHPDKFEYFYNQVSNFGSTSGVFFFLVSLIAMFFLSEGTD